jgi:rRNA-processing protein FCF1
MRPAPGVTLDEASRTLTEIIADLETVGPSPLSVQYLVWADACEDRLRGVFVEPDFWRGFTPRGTSTSTGTTKAMTGGSTPTCPSPTLAGQEAAAQLAYLRSLAHQTEQLRALAERPGRVLVYDTNRLMHYQPPGKISWKSVAMAGSVRLVVPLVVVDELDRKQHEGSDAMSRRARKALRALEQLLDGGQPGRAAPVPGCANVSIDLLMDEDGHTRVAPADDEIIERSVLVAQITRESVTVVTADTGMRLRPRTAGLQTLKLGQLRQGSGSSLGSLLTTPAAYAASSVHRYGRRSGTPHRAAGSAAGYQVRRMLASA